MRMQLLFGRGSRQGRRCSCCAPLQAACLHLSSRVEAAPLLIALRALAERGRSDVVVGGSASPYGASKVTSVRLHPHSKPCKPGLREPSSRHEQSNNCAAVDMLRSGNTLDLGDLT